MLEFNILIDIEICIKLFLSVLVGLFIGHERKKHFKSGGSRTVALVCLGATLMGILNLKFIEYMQLSDFMRLDIGRIPAYTLVAIGFLGRGLITKGKNGQIDGLTTASTLFVVVPTGICIGMSFYNIAFITTVLIFFILEMKYIKKTRRSK